MFKKLDDLQVRVRELLEAGDEESFNEGVELQKEVKKIMDDRFVTRYAVWRNDQIIDGAR